MLGYKTTVNLEDSIQKVINYIKDRYGHDSVAQIITFGTMKA